MRRYIIVVLILLSVMGIYAQTPNSSIGIRGGNSSGISMKYFYNETNAIEGILTIHILGRYLSTGLVERHKDAFIGIKNLKGFYGGGAHYGYWAPFSTEKMFKDPKEGDYFVFGVDAIIGVIYELSELPIEFQLDWKPAMNLHGEFDYYNDAAISIRYRLKT